MREFSLYAHPINRKSVSVVVYCCFPNRAVLTRLREFACGFDRIRLSPPCPAHRLLPASSSSETTIYYTIPLKDRQSYPSALRPRSPKDRLRHRDGAAIDPCARFPRKRPRSISRNRVLRPGRRVLYSVCSGFDCPFDFIYEWNLDQAIGVG